MSQSISPEQVLEDLDFKESNIIKNKDYYKSILKKSKVNLLFKKKDGTERKMTATLIPSYLPESTDSSLEKPKQKPKQKPKEESTEILKVFDLDQSAWRSCIIENIISIEPLE